MPKSDNKNEVHVCLNKRPKDCCESRNSLQLCRDLKKAFGDKVRIHPATCLSLCKQGPALKLILRGEEHLMIDGTVERVREFLEQHGI